MLVRSRGADRDLGAAVQAYADAGVQYFIVSMYPDYDRAAFRRFAKEVMPAFRKA